MAWLYFIILMYFEPELISLKFATYNNISLWEIMRTDVSWNAYIIIALSKWQSLFFNKKHKILNTQYREEYWNGMAGCKLNILHCNHLDPKEN